MIRRLVVAALVLGLCASASSSAHAGIVDWIKQKYDGWQAKKLKALTEKDGAEYISALVEEKAGAVGMLKSLGARIKGISESKLEAFFQWATKAEAFVRGAASKLKSALVAFKEAYDAAKGETACEKGLNLLNGIEPFSFVLQTIPEELGVEKELNPAAACYHGFRNGFICRVPDLIEEIVKKLIAIPKGIYYFYKLVTGPTNPKCAGKAWYSKLWCSAVQAVKAKAKGAWSCVTNLYDLWKTNKKALAKLVGKTLVKATEVACNAGGKIAFDAMIAAASHGTGSPALVASFVQSAIAVLEVIKNALDPKTWILFGLSFVPGLSSLAGESAKIVDNLRNLKGVAGKAAAEAAKSGAELLKKVAKEAAKEGALAGVKEAASLSCAHVASRKPAAFSEEIANGTSASQTLMGVGGAVNKQLGIKSKPVETTTTEIGATIKKASKKKPVTKPQ